MSRGRTSRRFVSWAGLALMWAVAACGQDPTPDQPGPSEGAGQAGSIASVGGMAGAAGTGANAGSGAHAGSAGSSGSSDLPEGKQHGGYTHKFLKNTGENQFAQLAYECFECSFANWLAVDPPAGWVRGPAQVVVSDRTQMRSLPSAEGHPAEVDLSAEVPGDEYRLIAKVLSAKVIQVPPDIVMETQVERDTILVFAAGRRVHEITVSPIPKIDGETITLSEGGREGAREHRDTRRLCEREPAPSGLGAPKEKDRRSGPVEGCQERAEALGFRAFFGRWVVSISKRAK